MSNKLWNKIEWNLTTLDQTSRFNTNNTFAVLEITGKCSFSNYASIFIFIYIYIYIYCIRVKNRL